MRSDRLKQGRFRFLRKLRRFKTREQAVLFLQKQVRGFLERLKMSKAKR
jgi:hypothetical protein